MAIETDESVSLPSPPPPRPAARQAAIDAALRKFDGEAPTEQADVRRAGQKWWATIHRRPAGALATTALIATIGVPAAMIALRDLPQDAAPAPAVKAEDNASDRMVPAAPHEEHAIAAAEPPPRARAPIPLPMLPHEDETRSTGNEQKVTEEAPAASTVLAAPPPPPPPPPPAPAPAPTRERFSEGAVAQDMVVTGSRIAQPNLEKPNAAGVAAERDGEPAGEVAKADPYRGFLTRLQSAVRANNRKAIVGLVALPLRVNFEGGSRTYNDRPSVERDFERIFTPRVRTAILNQRSDRIFSNWKGAMIGNGEVWFDQTCLNDSCTSVGPVRITAINR